MQQLAFITFVDDQGHDVGMPACEVLLVREHANGSTVITRSGVSILCQSTVAQIQTKIDTLWDEYTAALGDPV